MAVSRQDLWHPLARVAASLFGYRSGVEILRLRPGLHRARLYESLRLHAQVLGPLSPGRLALRLKGRRSLLLAALSEDRVVGYKFGYEDRPGRFYSWIGGVAPDHRRQGVGRLLMEHQHEWARRRGYRRVRTQTSNEHKPMLILNLRCGFDVVGHLLNHRGEARIVLERPL
jgi:GNAT superfamily N-acetyltransferase